MSQMNPKYPIYIISKGRWESRLTSKALEKMQVPYRIVIERGEYENYAAVIDPIKIIVLPDDFRQSSLYAIRDNSGQCGGGIPARNFVWEHSISEGHARHWILDDNIRKFYRLNKNIKGRAKDGTVFKAAEDFVDRYENVGLAGFQYAMFAPGIRAHPPFIANTRIYSCILLKNDLPYRWRGRYNEDTDLSLRILKDGWCTILFYAFLAEKITTMTMKGGNTDELYRGANSANKENDGRWLMAESLRQQHPDVVRVVRKWGRWQHQVDYRPFKLNKLVKRSGIEVPQGVNNYGMVFVDNRRTAITEIPNE